MTSEAAKDAHATVAAEAHLRALERMYLAGPINELYRPSIRVGTGTATIEMDVSERFFHSAGSLHGSVYFKMLDDAAFFAANSLEPERFVLTTSFTTELRKQVRGGRLRAEGRVLDVEGRRYEAEAELFDDAGRRVALGRGSFARSRIPLTDATGYAG